MDRKTKKRIEVLSQRLQKLRQQLAGAKCQTDEPDEVAQLQQLVEQTESELSSLRALSGKR